jgi:hypothetical protein
MWDTFQMERVSNYNVVTSLWSSDCFISLTSSLTHLVLCGYQSLDCQKLLASQKYTQEGCKSKNASLVKLLTPSKRRFSHWGWA